jgi:hypothetical protein
MMQTLEHWKVERDRILQAAKIRPAMYLGPQGCEHLCAIQDALGLVWIAKIFRQAQQATVFLSPHQFVIRCETGPILRSIRKILSWQGKEILTSDWSEELSQHLGPYTIRNHRRGSLRPPSSLRDQVIEQIHRWRLQSELADHPDDLPAMKRRVVDYVLHLFDERERERLAFDVLVAQILTQPLLGQTIEQLPSLGFDLPPSRTQRCDAGEIIVRPDARMRRPFPSFEPYPFGSSHMNEGPVDRAVADFEVVS